MSKDKRNMRLFWARAVASEKGLPDYKSLLQQARREFRMTQNDMAELTGLARPTLAKIEGRRRACRPETAARLAAAFGYPVAALFERQGAVSTEAAVGLPRRPQLPSPASGPKPSPPGPGSLLAVLSPLSVPTHLGKTASSCPLGSLLGLIVLTMAEEGQRQTLPAVWVWARSRWRLIAPGLGCAVKEGPPVPATAWLLLKHLDYGTVTDLLREWAPWREPPGTEGSANTATRMLNLLWHTAQITRAMVEQLRDPPVRKAVTTLRVLREDPKQLLDHQAGQGGRD